MPASTVSHDYHLTMFPHKLFLLERNRWKMLLADLRRPTRLALSPLLALSELMMWGYCLLRGPKFLRAKLDATAGCAANRERDPRSARAGSSTRFAAARTGSVLRGLHWGYPLDQFLTLGRERGESERDRIAASSPRAA